MTCWPVGKVVLASAAAFSSTNVDDGLILLAFMADRRFERWQIVAGQFLGIGALTLVSALVAALALRVSDGSTNWLGLIPLGLGTGRLWKQWRVGWTQSPVRHTNSGGALTVALVVFSSGGDNVAVNVPLIARIGMPGLGVLGAVFAAMTAIWCAAAWWLLSRPRISQALDAVGYRAMPFLLILVGLYVLSGL